MQFYKEWLGMFLNMCLHEYVCNNMYQDETQINKQNKLSVFSNLRVFIVAICMDREAGYLDSYI